MLREHGAKEPVLVPHDQIEEVAQERAVLDRRRQDGVGGDGAGAVPDEPPEVGIHRLQSQADQAGQAAGRRRVPGLEDVLLNEDIPPLLVSNPS